ncbi:MAG: alpha/beta fold hydrolase [candidate division Zixibacteria bacterium]|nr:alpha/beta fold hydrolase [candidate division Zixibacteria bacterium]
MPYADLGGYRMFYEEFGEGEPLVFLHGFTLDRRSWYGQAEYFKKVYRVIIVDALGHGQSDAPPERYGRFERVEDFQRFVEQLNLKQFHLVGLSMGGSTAIGYALEHQERLASLGLVATGASGYDIGKKYQKFDKMAKENSLESARDAWLEMTLAWFSGERAHARELLTQMIKGFSGVVWLDPMRGKYRTQVDLEHVHKITVPTCIIAGELDKVFVPLAKELHTRIAGSRLVILPKLGHLINLEDPIEFNNHLDAFLLCLHH